MSSNASHAFCDRSVGELVAEDYRRADVFKRYGIDFCCGGNRSVREVGAEKGINCDELTEALVEAEQAPLIAASGSGTPDVRAWPPEFLAAYITNVHHRYVRDRIPRIRELTRTVARVHGASYPETFQIVDLFDALATELEAHTQREETELFPYIEALADAERDGDVAPAPSAPQEAAWIEALEDEHDHAGSLLRSIRKATNDYKLPPSACNTYRLTYAELEAFEADLHRHVHLENNVLFPAAARLRAAVEQKSDTPNQPETESIMPDRILDVRPIPPREKHPSIFATFDALQPGEHFVLVNDHDPVPLRYQFEFERPGKCGWEYLEQGPQLWRVKISRVDG